MMRTSSETNHLKAEAPSRRTLKVTVPTVQRLRRIALKAAVPLGALVLAGCQVSELSTAAHLAPVPNSVQRKIERMGMSTRSPILVRIFKEENLLEVWKRDRSGRYALLKEYEICAWSGELGPKFKEGDRQAPEGFYFVGPGQMNPNSSYHLAFNIGFPNPYDRSHNRTGSHLMVHGDCSSRGCYAMEDENIEEIYALAREAFRGGQPAFQVHAFPFKMTPENMARHHDHKHFAFWEMLKEGYDHFEVSRQAPKIDACERRYVFNAKPNGGSFQASASCPAYTVQPGIERLVAEKRARDMEKRKIAIAKSMNREQRKERWEEREKAIATFFDRTRSGEADATPEASTAAPAPVPVAVAATTATTATNVSGAVPVPRPAPRSTATAAASRTSERSGGIRWNPFGRRKDEPVASVAAVAPSAPQPQATAPAPRTAAPAPGTAAAPAPAAPVASTAATNLPGVRPVQQQPTDQREPDASDTALRFQPQEDEKNGFFSSVAKGSQGLMRRAGNLFN